MQLGPVHAREQEMPAQLCDVFLDVANITDEPTRTDIALNGLRWYNTKQGVSFSGGVRGRF